MTTERDVEQQFARPFVHDDWTMFKDMADAYLQEAAKLKRADMPRYGVGTLLARNVRKRLFIGLGTELLLKALYLKRGYAINLTSKGGKQFPAKFKEHDQDKFKSKTAQFDDCIKSIEVVVALSPADLEGLKIAKIFRNKEAHSVLPTHAFAPETYRLIERALTAVYREGFAEALTITISMARNEKAKWVLKSIAP